MLIWFLLQLERHNFIQEGGGAQEGDLGQERCGEWRGEEEMKAEATQLETFFTQK